MNTVTHLRAVPSVVLQSVVRAYFDTLCAQGANFQERFATGHQRSPVHDADGVLTRHVQAEAPEQGVTASCVPARWNPPPLAVVTRATL